MESKIVSNYYECTITKDEKYKLVERGYQKNIGTFVDLFKDVSSNSFKVDPFLTKVIEIRKLF